MAMERRSESFNGSSYGAGTFGGGGSYEEPYQLKRYKTTKPTRSWDMGMQDPEMKRKKRVASYKVFTVEGKVKASVRNSFRWIKNKYIEVRYGWW